MNAVLREPEGQNIMDISQQTIEERAKETVERALQRNIPGIVIPQTESDLEVGLTPKEVVYTDRTARLYHFNPMQDEIYRTPVMFVMSPVAKGYILDLAKGQSLIEYLLLQGYDVFLLEWMTPRKEHAALGLKEYACEFIAAAINEVQSETGEQDINIIGYCMGGMLAAMYAALNSEGPINNLVCFTTPVNAEGMALYKSWIESQAFDIDRLVAELGIIPGDMVNASIQALRPLQKAAGQLNLLNNVENDAFVKAHLRFDHWAANQLPVPGQLMKELANDFLKANKFYNNQLQIAGERVDLGNIKVPFMHVAAEYDHIVPSEASRELVSLVGSEDKQEIVMKGGHVSLVAGGNAIYRLWPQLDSWLAPRSV
ncbi:MAG: alpha/beta fold hydrolase [Pseudomonadota bacterium]